MTEEQKVRILSESPQHGPILLAEMDAMKRQIETMNARIALDAKSYERDQYLISKLRKQLKTATQSGDRV